MEKAKMNLDFKAEKKDLPLYTIGIVAELIGTTNQTLRLYEKHGLVRPARKNKNRFYSDSDIRWLRCLRILIHQKKISIQGIKKLLEYAPCWEITDCPENARNDCRAHKDRLKRCWEINRKICRRKPNLNCEDCAIFLSRETAGS